MRLKILLLGLCAGALTACANYDLPYIGRTNEAAANDHRIIVLGQELKGGEKSARFVELVRNAEKARNIDHGASGLILRAALEGGLDGETNLDKVLEQPGDARCAEAKIAKINFHKANGGEIPPAFGKIITVELDQFDDPYWAGYIDLCTWIKNGDTYDEYLFHIDFEGRFNNSSVLRSHSNSGGTEPFPGTLEFSPSVDPSMIVAMMSQWDYKLHAKRDGVKYTNIWKNGTLLPRSDPAYLNDQDCFDVFVDAAGHALLVSDSELPAQNGYCMGRCDAIVLNTR